MIVDGKKMAEEIIAELGDALRGRTLGIVVNEADPASQSFIRIKERVAERLGVVVVRGSFDEVAHCDGVIVQLPNPGTFAIPREKDVDTYPIAPVAAAVAHILAHVGSQTSNVKAVVVGEGVLVGTPVAAMLRQKGYDVRVVSLEQGSLADLKDADVVVSGAGSPGLIKPEMLKPGVVLIDAGTSEQAGKLVGDADPACANVASLFTPTPGGVGPIAVAMLFKNLFELTR